MDNQVKLKTEFEYSQTELEICAYKIANLYCKYQSSKDINTAKELNQTAERFQKLTIRMEEIAKELKNYGG